MSHIIRRGLATPAALPPSLAASTSTLPQAVRRRRAEHPPHPSSSPSPFSDPALVGPTSPTGKTPKLLPPKLEQEFQSLRAKGQYKGDETSGRQAFLKGQMAWRSRMRGIAVPGKLSFLQSTDPTQVSPEEATSISSGPSRIVGQRIFLPNIQIRLVRNHTPPGEAYNPFIATFRIPPSMTKTDLRSYLLAVYGLKVTFIRTDNYIGEVTRVRPGNLVRKGGARDNYKRAVVGLEEPFHYPDDIEELYAQGELLGVGDKWAKAREQYLEKAFAKTEMDRYRDRMRAKVFKGYRWRSRSDNMVSYSAKMFLGSADAREMRCGTLPKRGTSAKPSCCELSSGFRYLARKVYHNSSTYAYTGLVKTIYRAVPR